MWSSYKCTSHSVQLIDTYWVKVLVAQSCLTLCYPMDYSPPGSSVHGDSSRNNTRVVAMPSSKGTSPPRDETQVSHMAGRFFTFWATTEAHLLGDIRSHHFMTNRWGNVGNRGRLYFLGLQNHCRWWLQPQNWDACSLEEKVGQI